jgi:hypothetical protein
MEAPHTMLPNPSSFISTNKNNPPSEKAIKADASIEELVAKYPSTAGVFQRWGLDPLQQPALRHESLSATCLVHHIDCNELIAELETAL